MDPIADILEQAEMAGWDDEEIARRIQDALNQVCSILFSNVSLSSFARGLCTSESLFLGVRGYPPRIPKLAFSSFLSSSRLWFWIWISIDRSIGRECSFPFTCYDHDDDDDDDALG